MYTIDIAMLFLMLAFETMTTDLKLDKVLRTHLSSLQIWAALLSLFLLFVWWNEKQLEKVSTNWKSEENLLLRESNVGKIPLRQLLASTTELLIFSHCLKVIFSSNRWWKLVFSAFFLSRRDLIAWLFERVDVLSWCCPLSFWRYRWMETKPAIILISKVGNI